jgi:cytidyltransferase-like protein
MTIVCVSGGFDPTHIGHARLISEAALYGEVVVLLNSDDWLMKKKGFVFMPWEQRAEMLMTMKGVSKVTHVEDTDETVCKALARIRPDFFANGGDRFAENTPELKVCLDLGIKPLFNVGGKKIASSSDLVKRHGV